MPFGVRATDWGRPSCERAFLGELLVLVFFVPLRLKIPFHSYLVSWVGTSQILAIQVTPMVGRQYERPRGWLRFQVQLEFLLFYGLSPLINGRLLGEHESLLFVQPASLVETFESEEDNFMVTSLLAELDGLFEEYCSDAPVMEFRIDDEPSQTCSFPVAPVYSYRAGKLSVDGCSPEAVSPILQLAEELAEFPSHLRLESYVKSPVLMVVDCVKLCYLAGNSGIVSCQLHCFIPLPRGCVPPASYRLYLFSSLIRCLAAREGLPLPWKNMSMIETSDP